MPVRPPAKLSPNAFAISAKKSPRLAPNLLTSFAAAPIAPLVLSWISGAAPFIPFAIASPRPPPRSTSCFVGISNAPKYAFCTAPLLPVISEETLPIRASAPYANALSTGDEPITSAVEIMVEYNGSARRSSSPKR